MSDTAKKSTLIVLVIAAAVVAIWQGTAYFKGQSPQYVGKPMGNFSAGHTGKAAMLANSGQSQAK